MAVLVTGDPVPPARAARGSFIDMIRAAVGAAWPGPWLEVECRGGSAFPPLGDVAGLVVTGSSASVTERAPWILDTEAYLARATAAGTAVFGICFGHQLLGQALGGSVIVNPRGRQIGTVEAALSASDPMIDAEALPYWVNTTHRDIVDVLPPGARLLATTPKDPNAFVRFADRVWGVQFHPEFDAVTMSAYIESRREILVGEGFDPDALLARVSDALPGQSSLVRFARFVAAEVE